jgi:hypothetical protein
VVVAVAAGVVFALPDPHAATVIAVRTGGARRIDRRVIVVFFRSRFSPSDSACARVV